VLGSLLRIALELLREELVLPGVGAAGAGPGDRVRREAIALDLEQELRRGTDDFERAMEEETGRKLDRFFERWIYGVGIPRVSYHAAVAGNVATLTFEQRGDVFDLPVTVAVTGVDGRTREFVVELTEATAVRTLQHDGPIRQVQVNRDGAALAEFDER